MGGTIVHLKTVGHVGMPRSPANRLARQPNDAGGASADAEVEFGAQRPSAAGSHRHSRDHGRLEPAIAWRENQQFTPAGNAVEPDNFFGAPDATFMCSTFGQRSSNTCIPAIAHNAVSESRPTPPAALCAELTLIPGVGRLRAGSVSELRCGFPSDCGLSSAIQDQ